MYRLVKTCDVKRSHDFSVRYFYWCLSSIEIVDIFGWREFNFLRKMNFPLQMLTNASLQAQMTVTKMRCAQIPKALMFAAARKDSWEMDSHVHVS